jgi:hypothetical protein
VTGQTGRILERLSPYARQLWDELCAQSRLVGDRSFAINADETAAAAGVGPRLKSSLEALSNAGLLTWVPASGPLLDVRLHA